MATVRSRLATIGTYDALLLVSGVWFLGKFARYAFPPLFEPFQGTYGVTNGELGLLFTGLMIAYAGMQFPSGALADRFGSTRVIVAGVGVLAAAALLLFGFHGLPALAAAMFLIGIGTGAHKTVAINLLAAVYPARTGRTLGIMDTAGELAGVAAPAVVVLALATAGWPPIFLAIGVAGTLLGLAVHARIPRRPRVDRSNGDGSAPSRRYLTTLGRPRVAAFVLVVVAFAFAWNGLAAFLPLYLTTEKGFTPTRASLLYGGLFAVSVIQPVTGALSDRVGRFPVLVATLGVATAGLAALVATVDALVVAGLVLVIGVGSHGFRPVRDSHLMDVLPAAAAGGTLGIVRTIMMGVGALSPAIVGYLSDGAGWTVAFGTLAAGFCVSAAAVVALAATR